MKYYNSYSTELLEKGYVHIKSFYKVDQIKQINQKIIQVINSVSSFYLGNSCEDISLEGGAINKILQHMQYNRRDLISIIYDAVKTIPEFCRLVSSEQNIELAKLMRTTDSIGITRGGEGIRMDLPREEKFMAPWHQDYLSQFGSYDGLVFWAPLVNITQDIGPIKVLINSHKEGLLPVYYENTESINTAYGMRICDEEKLIKQYEDVDLICEVGDLLIIDFKTIHKSGFNVSDKVRWSMQIRYFNFNDPLGVSKGWPSGLTTGKKLSQIHPELLLSKIKEKPNVN